LVLIVGAFVGGTLLTQAISRQMEANASDIASNAAPSVQQLSLARTTLAKIRILAERANQECAKQDAPFFADEIERTAGEVQDSVAAYLAAPVFPGEGALQQGLKSKIADLRSILTEYVGLLRTGQCETARELEEGGFSRAAAQASVAFGNLIDFNARQIERLVREIGEIRSRTTPWLWRSTCWRSRWRAGSGSCWPAPFGTARAFRWNTGGFSASAPMSSTHSPPG